MDPDQTAPKGSSLIRVHSVCIDGKNIFECIEIYAPGVISRQLEDNKIGRIRVNMFKCIILLSRKGVKTNIKQ